MKAGFEVAGNEKMDTLNFGLSSDCVCKMAALLAHKGPVKKLIVVFLPASAPH